MRASSDVNLLIVLNRLDADRLDRVSDLIQAGSAAIELHPLFMLYSELPLAIEAFAVKFDDIAHRHVLLFGANPFDDRVIPRELLIGRVNAGISARRTRAFSGSPVDRLLAPSGAQEKARNSDSHLPSADTRKPRR